jgi:hypothetical protein
MMKALATATFALVTAVTAGCGKSAHHPTTPVDDGDKPGGPGAPGATMCVDLGTVIDAAREDFPDYRLQDKPVTVENNPGFESSFVMPGTLACRILTSEEPYPDAYECDLAAAGSLDASRAVIDRWAAAVGACPQLEGWHANDPTELGRGWELETGDDHELAVQLFLAGPPDHPTPTLIVRRNEI